MKLFVLLSMILIASFFIWKAGGDNAPTEPVDETPPPPPAPPPAEPEAPRKGFRQKPAIERIPTPARRAARAARKSKANTRALEIKGVEESKGSPVEIRVERDGDLWFAAAYVRTPGTDTFNPLCAAHGKTKAQARRKCQGQAEKIVAELFAGVRQRASN